MLFEVQATVVDHSPREAARPVVVDSEWQERTVAGPAFHAENAAPEESNPVAPPSDSEFLYGRVKKLV